MALTRSISRLDLAPVPQTVGDAIERGPLIALSQRKLNALGTPIAYIDRNQRYRFANKALLDWLGKRSEEVLNREIIEVMGRESYQIYRAYVEAALGGERTGYEWQLALPGRAAIWIRVDYYPDRNQQGHIRGFLATYSDVDQLKRLEVEAGQREHRLRLVTDSVGLPILHFDRQLRLRFANKPFADWIGVPADDLIGHALSDFLPSDALTEMQGYIERAFAGATVAYERRERRASGELRWVRVTLFPDRELGGRVGGAFAVWNDIEDDVRVRDALKSQQQQLRLFADNIPGPIAYLDKSLHYTFVNQAFANWVCKPQDEIYGKTPFEVMASDVAAFLRPVLKRAQAGEHVEYERVGQNANGQRRWMHGRMAPDLDSTGKVRGLYCTEYDIHDLKQTEQELAAREKQLRLFTDNIPEPVVYLDAERRYVFVNEAFLDLYGLPREDVIGKKPEEVLGVEGSQALTPDRDRAMKSEALTYERAVIDVVGRTRWIRARCVPDLNFDGSVRGEYVVGHDITDLKLAQDALAARESQLRAIMDGVPAPVAYIDHDERCHYVNRTFLQYFGLTVDQIGYLRLRDIVGQSLHQSAQAMLSRALEGESTSFDRLVPGANGARRWMTIRVVPDAGPSGEVHGAFVLMNDIHGLKQAQEALRASEGELRLIMDNVPARVSYIDRDYRYRFLNGHNEQWLGASRDAMTGRAISEVAGAARFETLKPLLDRVLEGEVVSTEMRLPQPSGEMQWEAIHYAPNRDSDGNVIGIYAVHTDIHDQKRNEDALRHANWMLSSHMSNTPLAVLEWDRDQKLVRWSPQAEVIFGWDEKTMLGRSITNNPLLHEDNAKTMSELIDRLLSGHEPRETSITKNYRQDGNTVWCEWYHSALVGDDGKVVSLLSFVQDVSSRMQAEERLQYMATHDGLTGLPNSVLLNDRLEAALVRARRSSGRVGVMFLDLDHFKDVNDTLGHRIGDLLLKELARRIRAALRESDLLARVSGDEFVIVMEDFPDESAPELVARKVLDEVRRPFHLEGHELHVSGSLGLALHPEDGGDAETLLKNADAAMYHAKELGRNGFRLFSSELAARRSQRLQVETALRRALRGNELTLYYQPIIDIASGSVHRAEALLRWQDPERGLVLPQSFIPLAEESGLGHAVGHWVIEHACRQARAWRDAGLGDINVCVNLSASQLRDSATIADLKSTLAATGCEPGWLQFEITETSMVRDVEGASVVLAKLRALGVRIAIDDFGTGFSSLSRLRHLPVDVLKIDKAFVADITPPVNGGRARPPRRSDAAGGAAIVSAVIGLARGLGLDVVAEGVEKKSQLHFLTREGCTACQGYLLCPPLAASEFDAWLRNRTKLGTRKKAKARAR